MRITNQMLAKSAAKSGISLQGTSLLNILNHKSSSGLLGSIGNNTSTSASKILKKSNYSKLEDLSEKLNKYAEKNLISKENCYNYSDTVKSDSPLAKQLYYGVRITPEEEPSTNKIVITKYGLNTANRIIYKSQLKLKTKEGVIIEKDMTLVSRNMNCHISKKDKVKVKRAGIRMSV